MITLTVDQKTCKKDGRCVEVCPMRILKLSENDRLPEFIPGGAERCINCGHCLAVCPHGSISLSTMSVNDAVLLNHEALPNPAQVELFLKSRRSIRAYKDTPVSTEAIEKLLDIARYAPSGINRQPVNWSVIMGKERVLALSECVVAWMQGLLAEKSPLAESLHFDHLIDSWKKGEDRICRQAPCLIFAYGLKDDPMVPQACTIAATYLELAAFGSGLGACWAGYATMAINTSPAVRKCVGLSPRAVAGAGMMVGFPKYRYVRIPSRNTARIKW